MLSSLIKRAAFGLINPIFRVLFSIAVRASKKKILVVDIDNTIADTWKTIGQKNTSEYARLINLELLKGTKEFIDQTDATVIFLTARNYRHVPVTRQWLENQGFIVDIFHMIFVLEAHQKVSYLKKIAHKKEVIFIDDLSFNHEKGAVEFYKTTIDAVKKLPITYYDYNFILDINKSNFSPANA